MFKFIECLILYCNCNDKLKNIESFHNNNQNMAQINLLDINSSLFILFSFQKKNIKNQHFMYCVIY